MDVLRYVSLQKGRSRMTRRGQNWDVLLEEMKWFQYLTSSSLLDGLVVLWWWVVTALCKTMVADHAFTLAKINKRKDGGEKEVFLPTSPL